MYIRILIMRILIWMVGTALRMRDDVFCVYAIGGWSRVRIHKVRSTPYASRMACTQYGICVFANMACALVHAYAQKEGVVELAYMQLDGCACATGSVLLVANQGRSQRPE